MPKPKIDRVKLNQMLRDGKPQITIAQFFGVTAGAISKAKKELNIAVVKNTALEAGHRVVEEHLNTVAQLRKINDKANAILDDLMSKIENEKETPERKKDLREIALKSMQEIRNQLSLQLDIVKTLYDVRDIADFQRTVVEVIGRQRPKVRVELVEALKRARALRGTVEIKP